MGDFLRSKMCCGGWEKLRMSSAEETAVAVRMQDLSPAYKEIMVLGKVLQASGYFKDIRDQAQAVTKILWGKELGFTPIVALSGIHIIEGKPALSSNLMATLIKRSGRYDYRVKVWTDVECVLTFREKNGAEWEDVGESSFTMDDAKRAGVVRAGGSWSKFPKAMLFARALSQGLRTYCPDVSAAPIYNPEEMGATVDEEGAVTELPKSARPVQVTTEDIEITPTPKVEPEERRELPSEEQLITSEQAKKLHIRFRETLREDLRPLADKLLYDFLGSKMYLDAAGNPSAGAIRKDEFAAVGKAAVAHAKEIS